MYGQGRRAAQIRRGCGGKDEPAAGLEGPGRGFVRGAGVEPAGIAHPDSVRAGRAARSHGFNRMRSAGPAPTLRTLSRCGRPVNKTFDVSRPRVRRAGAAAPQ